MNHTFSDEQVLARFLNRSIVDYITRPRSVLRTHCIPGKEGTLEEVSQTHMDLDQEGNLRRIVTCARGHFTRLAVYQRQDGRLILDMSFQDDTLKNIGFNCYYPEERRSEQYRYNKRGDYLQKIETYYDTEAREIRYLSFKPEIGVDEDITTEYTAHGKIERVVYRRSQEPSKSTEFEYDLNGRLVRKTAFEVPEKPIEITTYRYFDDGSQETLLETASGKVAEYRRRVLPEGLSVETEIIRCEKPFRRYLKSLNSRGDVTEVLFYETCGSGKDRLLHVDRIEYVYY